MKKLHRRTFLRGVGEVAIALPFLEIMGAGSARAAETGPKRLVLLGVPLSFGDTIPSSGAGGGDATHIDMFWPTGGETDFTMSEVLKPLDPLRQDLLILKHIGRESSQNGHGAAYANMTTGWPGNPTPGNPNAISIDQYIADRITPGVHKSLHFRAALGTGYWGVNQGFSLKDPKTFNVPEFNPQKIFFDLFRNLNPGPPDPNDPNVIKALQERQRTQSILDAVKIEHGHLKLRLGKSDRATLDAHLTSIREIERKLQAASAAASSGALCSKPTMVFPAGAPPVPTDANWKTTNQYWGNVQQSEAASAVMIDLTVAALACDLTRVLTLEWALWSSMESYPFLGVSDNHALSHGGDPRQSIKVYNWYAKQMASLATKLKEKQEGGGTILDNTAIVYMQELSCGNHKTHNQPTLIAGKCGGYFKTGRFIEYPKLVYPENRKQRLVNDLHLTLIEAMGLPPPPGNAFGEPSWCKGVLPNLT